MTVATGEYLLLDELHLTRESGAMFICSYHSDVRVFTF